MVYIHSSSVLECLYSWFIQTKNSLMEEVNMELHVWHQFISYNWFNLKCAAQICHRGTLSQTTELSFLWWLANIYAKRLRCMNTAGCRAWSQRITGAGLQLARCFRMDWMLRMDRLRFSSSKTCGHFLACRHCWQLLYCTAIFCCESTTVIPRTPVPV